MKRQWGIGGLSEVGIILPGISLGLLFIIWSLLTIAPVMSFLLKAPSDPEYSHVILPSKALLFRFSALTFNAHSIHLDQHYAKNTEGYRNLLVHGPLSLTIMLTVLRCYLYRYKQVIRD